MSYTVYDTPALVVDSWPYKDASRRLALQTKHIGRILVRAQSVRKVDSKLQSATQLYSESTIEVVYGKSGWRLVGALPKRNSYFQADVGRKAINRSVNLLTRLVPDQQPDPALFSIVTSGLQALSSADQDTVDTAETLFVLRVVSALGYAPDPSADNLQKFVGSNQYDRQYLSRFSDHRNQAVQQINQALNNSQM
jgi:recombinational DNA repair protein (RecF pathway)